MNSIVFIDDNEIDQFVLKKLISRNHSACSVLSFFNGEEALRYFNESLTDQSASPDLILLDLNMPGISGWEFLDKFQPLNQTLKSPVKIFILTSSISDKDNLMVKNYPCVTEFFNKPITEEIVNKIFETWG